MPLWQRAKMVCLLSLRVVSRASAIRFIGAAYSQGVFSVVMKNWLPFVLGPAFAMLTV